MQRGQLPFFAYIGTPGPHASSIPAWWHRRRTATLKRHAPRTPNFNALASDHHPLLSSAPPLDAAALDHVDTQFRARWGTLWAIDDMVAGILRSVDELGIGNNTYIMLTSDHGFHLGQFRIPQGKEMPYETDIRVPFFCRGPGIAPGTQIPQLIANIDIAPTLCDLAGLPVPPLMDGRSFAPLLRGGPGIVHDNVLSKPWRTHFLVEFYDGSVREWGSVSCWDTDPDCATDLEVPGPWGPNCTRVPHTCQGVGGHGLGAGCPCKEGGSLPANPCPGPMGAEGCPHRQRHDFLFSDPDYNWRALRVINVTHNFTFVQFDPNRTSISNVTFFEFYDLSKDEWQMRNLWPSLPAHTRSALETEMERYVTCSGSRTTPSTCE